jgi:hypothetical protein
MFLSAKFAQASKETAPLPIIYVNFLLNKLVIAASKLTDAPLKLIYLRMFSY